MAKMQMDIRPRPTYQQNAYYQGYSLPQQYPPYALNPYYLPMYGNGMYEYKRSSGPGNYCLMRLKDAWLFVKSYLRHSNIHGVCYMAKDELTWFEKLFWLCLVIGCLTGCILIGLQSLDRFYTKSTVISLESDYCYWNTTLPSTTICPLERLNRTLFDKYCDSHWIDGTRKEELFDFLEKLANSTYINFNQIPEYDSVEDTLASLDILPSDYMALIFQLTTDLTNNEIVKSDDGDIRILVRQVLTEFGLCYLTNSYLGDVYNARYMIFKEQLDEEQLEKQKHYAPVKTGMSLHKEALYAVKGFVSDIQIFVHSAYETMRLDGSSYFTHRGFEIEPHITEIVADDGLEKAATVSQRKCRFEHESNLTHFPVYTRNMCLQECRLNLAYKLCKCIPHFYPNKIAKQKTVCSYKVLKTCMWENRVHLLKLYTTKGKYRNRVCYCLPNCRDAFVRIMKGGVTKGGLILLQTSTNTVKMTTWPRNRFKRQIIFTITDLFVSIGGTAGLFLGFSVLGATEIVYYFTLRLLCSLCGHKHD